jgi:hypothetical protein
LGAIDRPRFWVISYSPVAAVSSIFAALFHNRTYPFHRWEKVSGPGIKIARTPILSLLGLPLNKTQTINNQYINKFFVDQAAPTPLPARRLPLCIRFFIGYWI